MLDRVQQRLDPSWDARVQGFVGHATPDLVSGLHAGLFLLAGVVGFSSPLLATALCLVTMASLIGEGSGRFSLIRRLLPRAASYNLVVHRPDPSPRGTLVVAAHMDSARFWRWTSWRPLRRPMQAVFASAWVLLALSLLRSLAEPWGPRTLQLYVAALVVLAVAVLLGALTHRTGTGRDDPSGVAVALELLRRHDKRAVSGVELWVVFTGCGRGYQDGMHAFLDQWGPELAEPCLVVSLDSPASAPLGAAISEGNLFAQMHRPTGPALVERMRWAGAEIAVVDKPGVTDARAALVRGYRALSLTGGGGSATVNGALRAADVLENVLHWYGEDLAGVAHHKPELERRWSERDEAPTGELHTLTEEAS